MAGRVGRAATGAAAGVDLGWLVPTCQPLATALEAVTALGGTSIMTWVAELRGRPTMGGLRLTPGAVGNFGKDVAFLLAVAKMHNPRWLISPKPTVEWGSVFVNWDEASDMLGYVCEMAIDSGRELSLFGDEEARRNPTGSSAERRRIGTAGPMEALPLQGQGRPQKERVSQRNKST